MDVLNFKKMIRSGTWEQYAEHEIIKGVDIKPSGSFQHSVGKC